MHPNVFHLFVFFRLTFLAYAKVHIEHLDKNCSLALGLIHTKPECLALSYVIGGAGILVNTLFLGFWLFFFFSLKNYWKDISDLITIQFNGYGLQYSLMIFGTLATLWGHSIFLCKQRILILFDPNIHHVDTLSFGMGTVLWTGVIFIIFDVLGPFMLWMFASQFLMAPIKWLETFFPPMAGVIQIICAVVGSCLGSSLEHREEACYDSCPCSKGSWYISLKKITQTCLFMVRVMIDWIIPLCCFSSLFLLDPTHFLYSEVLPKKPKLIAHRGFTERGHPENSFSAIKEALNHADIHGVEVDIRISADGIPFIMHDVTLQRTANVHEIFPKRCREAAERFTFADLRRLTLIGGMKNEKIPKFKDVLQELHTINDNTKDHDKKMLIFDLFNPENDWHDKHEGIIEKEIKTYPGIEKQVIFLNMELSQKGLYPNSIHATDFNNGDALSECGIGKEKNAKREDGGLKIGLNVEYLVPSRRLKSLRLKQEKSRSATCALRRSIWNIASSFFKLDRDGQRADSFWMCEYVLSEKYLFSQAWCLGVDAVIVNTVDQFARMTKPIWWIRRSKRPFYVLFVVACGIINFTKSWWGVYLFCSK